MTLSHLIGECIDGSYVAVLCLLFIEVWRG